jgi:general secretion pathway protein D
LLVAIALVAASCAAGKAFRRGDAAMHAGDLDQAVAQYRAAVQAAPDNANYKIALQRAMQAASRLHLVRAKEFEDKDQLDAALGEYKLATEYDPGNRLAYAKVAGLERTIRDRVEAARPKPPIQQMRERARATSAEPTLNPSSRTPLDVHFNNVSLKSILDFLSSATGISIVYDREFVDRPATVNLDGVTFEQALTQILSTNQLSSKILNEKAILVFTDSIPKHQAYDEQVIKTVYLSNADPTDLQQILSTVVRFNGLAIQPAIAINKNANSITMRGTPAIVQILEKIIDANDKPRAEIVVDVEILEVDRSRTKQYGLNLSDYAIGGIFSPESAPSATTTTTGTGAPATTAATGSTPPNAVRSPAAFNLNTISRGVSTADFYLAVPTAIVRFLESDNHTKVIAKPQLRGAEGTKLSLKLGDKFPVISTSYTPIATGGAGQNPLNSYTFMDIGVNIDMTPRVTLEGDILLDLTIEDTAHKSDVVIAGSSYPSFGQRTVTTRLRLRDGESNMLAGLLQENDTTNVQGFPGAIHLPFLKQLFSANVHSIDQTDIVMLLTPHIVRTHEITEADLRPIYIGSQGAAGGGLGVGGPPPMIQGPPEAPPAPAPAAGAPVPGAAAPGTPPYPTSTTVGGAVVTAPPGSTPVPGTVVVPPAPTPPPATPPNVTALTPPPETPTTPPGVPPAAPPAQTPAGEPPITSPGVGSAQIVISPPPTARVGGGPYSVPVSINGATRLTTITLTVQFDPGILRLRTVQEGSFMRTGGGPVTFNQQPAVGRVDITISRGADVVGASGTGLLANLLFDAIAPGSVTLTVSGAATGPGGTPMGLQFRPVTVVVQ